MLLSWRKGHFHFSSLIFLFMFITFPYLIPNSCINFISNLHNLMWLISTTNQGIIFIINDINLQRKKMPVYLIAIIQLNSYLNFISGLYLLLCCQFWAILWLILCGSLLESCCFGNFKVGSHLGHISRAQCSILNLIVATPALANLVPQPKYPTILKPNLNNPSLSSLIIKYLLVKYQTSRRTNNYIHLKHRT